MREPGSEDRIWWDGNSELPEEPFEPLREKVTDFLAKQPTLYVVDAFAGADPAHRIAVRVITTHPYHALFAKTMFIDPTPDEAASFQPQALVLHAPALEAKPEEDGTRTGTFIVLHPTRTEVLIGGTFYAGEIKKSIFTVMNDRLPLENVFPMHCSANVGDDGRTSRSSSGSPAPARRRSPPTRSARSSATTSTAGATTASSTSKAAATRR